MFTSGEISIPDTGLRKSQLGYSPDDVVLEKKVLSAKATENNESLTNFVNVRRET